MTRRWRAEGRDGGAGTVHGSGSDRPGDDRPGAGMAGRTAAFAVSVAVQFAVLYWPRAAAAPSPLPVDKVVHVAIFAAVAWTGLRLGLAPAPLLGALLVHAGVSEIVQATLLVQRSGDPGDAVADAVGVAFGAVAARFPTRGVG